MLSFIDMFTSVKDASPQSVVVYSTGGGGAGKLPDFLGSIIFRVPILVTVAVLLSPSVRVDD